MRLVRRGVPLAGTPFAVLLCENAAQAAYAALAARTVHAALSLAAGQPAAGAVSPQVRRSWKERYKPWVRPS